MMKHSTYLIIIISVLNFVGLKKVCAQDYKNQFSLSSNNDQYIDPDHDRYYTDGIIFNFTHALRLPSSHSKLVKKTFELEFGQNIYNAFSASAVNLQPGPFQYKYYGIDRPFTAYLFAGASLNLFYKNGDALKLNAQAGTIGPAALGEQVQTGFHKFFNLYRPRGWIYQLKNAPGINLRGDYKMFLCSPVNWFDVAFNPQAWLGNTFTGAATGMQLRLGQFNQLYQSVITNSRVTSNSGEHAENEFYFFTTPQLNYVGYDATIQGGMFLKNKGPVTFNIYHIVYQQQFGLQYGSKKWSLSYVAFVRSREVKSTALADQWASINLAYRFGKN